MTRGGNLLNFHPSPRVLLVLVYSSNFIIRLPALLYTISLATRKELNCTTEHGRDLPPRESYLIRPVRLINRSSYSQLASSRCCRASKQAIPFLPPLHRSFSALHVHFSLPLFFPFLSFCPLPLSLFFLSHSLLLFSTAYLQHITSPRANVKRYRERNRTRPILTCYIPRDI